MGLKAVLHKIRFLMLVLLALTVPSYAAEPSLSNEAAAKALRLFRQNGIAMDNLKISKFIQYRQGGGMVVCHQTYKGLPIFFAQVAYHFNAKGKVKRTRKGQVFVGGAKKIGPKRINVDVTPTITRAEAVDIFVKRSARSGFPIDPSSVEVVLGLFDIHIFGSKKTPLVYGLAWHATIAAKRYPFAISPFAIRYPFAIIGATGGGVLMFDDGRSPRWDWDK
jgi:hypothetical protein